MKAFVCLLILCSSSHVSVVLAQTSPAEDAAKTDTTKVPAKTSIQGRPLSPQTLSAALETVNALLAKMKSGDDAAGYDLLSPEAQKSETDSQWQQMIAQMQELAGARQHSTFRFGLLTDDLPQAQPGEYVVIGLNSVFEKERLVETFILINVEGRYMVSGYHFQNPVEAGQTD